MHLVHQRPALHGVRESDNAGHTMGKGGVVRQSFSGRVRGFG